MANKKRKKGKNSFSDTCLGACLVFLFCVWLIYTYPAVSIGIAAIGAVIFIVYYVQKYSNNSHNYSKGISDYDSMTGRQFEDYCKFLLKKNGFVNISTTKASGDQGIDLIAYRSGYKYGIQCKRYKSHVGNKAVQEVYAGIAAYNCDYGAVLTNNYFTQSAKELAQKTGIELWDKDSLDTMIRYANKY